MVTYEKQERKTCNHADCPWDIIGAIGEEAQCRNCVVLRMEKEDEKKGLKKGRVV